MTPQAPPPYYLFDGLLPEDTLDSVLRRGESLWALADAKEVTWRQPLQHIESMELLSVEVVDTLEALAPGCFKELNRVIIHEQPCRRISREYVFGRPTPLDGSGSIIGAACDPSLEGKISRQIQGDAGTQVLAFSREIARSDKLLNFRTSDMYVTDGFRDAWLDTEISKYMRSTNGEYDFSFTPGVGGYNSDNAYERELQLRFKWVDPTDNK